jgi:tetratricopeptide (TPR) repeat protein
MSVSLHAQPSDIDLANVKTLYANASFEEALAELGTLSASNWNEHVDEYRALCLLALGRTQEAEEVLEHLVRHSPLHTLADDQFSPRLVSLFEAVRGQTVPAVARELYTKAKGVYEAGRLDDAIAQFQQFITLLSDASLVEQSPNLGELKELGEEFLKLAEEKRRAQAPSSSDAAVPTPPSSAPTAQNVLESGRTFTANDRDVTPPVEVQRVLPKWTPPANVRARFAIRGTLEVVTDERGAIESAKMVKPLSPFYDNELLAATKQWKYRPATKGNVPVKYRWLMEIVLAPE